MLLGDVGEPLTDEAGEGEWEEEADDDEAVLWLSSECEPWPLPWWWLLRPDVVGLLEDDEEEEDVDIVLLLLLDDLLYIDQGDEK